MNVELAHPVVLVAALSLLEGAYLGALLNRWRPSSGGLRPLLLLNLLPPAAVLLLLRLYLHPLQLLHHFLLHRVVTLPQLRDVLKHFALAILVLASDLVILQLLGLLGGFGSQLLLQATASVATCLLLLFLVDLIVLAHGVLDSPTLEGDVHSHCEEIRPIGQQGVVPV